MTAVPAKRSPLMPLDNALEALLAHALPVDAVELVSTFDADGRVLAEDIVSQLDVPAFDNSSMDGYAVRAADLLDPAARLPVVQRIAAGHSPVPLAPGQAARIFTGAPMPQGADSVVMQEDTTLHPANAGASDLLQVRSAVQEGQWVRPRGDDVREGQVVLRAGERLGPAHLGLAASLGLAQLPVARRPRVALFSTGDELVMPGDCAPQDLPKGAIYNSNRFFLRNLLTRLGAQVQDLGIVPDNREATLQALQGAAQHNDLILTSGGVSVGEEDHIKPAVSALGHLDLWQIAIKPGKPFAYGTVRRRETPSPKSAEPVGAVRADGSTCHFIGLPGNPVSSFVTFLVLVRPFLLALQGARQLGPRVLQAKAAFDWPKADKRREFLRARLNAQGLVELFPNQSSGVLTSLAWGDVLVDNPAGQTIAQGDSVKVLLISELMS
jgi:molybdopterin molybdotransferase